MIDPGTGLATLGAALGSAKLLEKLLGPTAEYIGDGIKEWTERRVKNTARIFEIARARLGAKMEEDGAVPPRALKEILFEGSFVDDPLMAEYFGGVLASSRSKTGNDDRAASFLKLVGSLSCPEVHLHYLIYTTVHREWADSGLQPGMAGDLERAKLFLPYSGLLPALGLAPESEWQNILTYSLTGLHRQGLLDPGAYGNAEFLNKEGSKRFSSKWQGATWIEVDEGGVVVGPTHAGIDLLMWAMGHGHHMRHEFFSIDLGSGIPDVPPLAGGRRAVNIVEAS